MVEVALVRISQLAHLEDLATIIQQLQSGSVSLSAPATPTAISHKKKVKSLETASVRPAAATAANPRTLAAESPNLPAAGAAPTRDTVSATAASPASTAIELTEENAVRVWEQSIEQLDGLAADAAREYESVRLDGDHHLTVTLKTQYHANRCKRPDHKEVLEAALANIVGQSVTLSVDVKAAQKSNTPQVAQRSQAELIRESYEHPLVKQAMELFGADVTSVQDKKK